MVHPKQLRQRLARLELASHPMRHRPAPNEARNGRRTGTVYIIDERTRVRLLTLSKDMALLEVQVRLLLMA